MPASLDASASINAALTFPPVCRVSSSPPSLPALQHGTRCAGVEQLTQGEEATPIFTPGDGYNWKIAMASFEAADFM